ncbi:hypothetical protein D918_03136 [Trichuris suis]|nr:hypothetical protein D918_03136 [Trichuris suis]
MRMKKITALARTSYAAPIPADPSGEKAEENAVTSAQHTSDGQEPINTDKSDAESKENHEAQVKCKAEKEEILSSYEHIEQEATEAKEPDAEKLTEQQKV